VSRGALLSLLMLAPGWGACGEAVVQGLDRNRCAANPDGAGCPPRVWPNALSKANSDLWLRDHHDNLIRLEPQVLVLDFYNSKTLAEIQALAMDQAAALAESSRYHGYADAAAPAFVQYKIWRVVDLTDHPVPAGQPLGSSMVPTTAGMFDPMPLFSEDYANRYAIADPMAPGRNLTLCELFERGMVNEVWMAVGDDPPRGPLTLERKQIYDAAGAPTGQFAPCAGGAGCLNAPCAVTVRLAHLTPIRGLTCDVEIRTFPFESEYTWGAIPYLAANAVSFFNADFHARFGVPFDSWYDVCGMSTTPCITYPTPSSASGVDLAGAPFSINPFIQGCGSARFPPNARFRNDFGNPAPVQSRCEHFGLKDGPSGEDTLDTYTPAKGAGGTNQFGGDCGGGWQIYLRQNMPGLGNRALASDRKPMKNWWPFSFY
jgi:hypothetical protein